MIRTKSQEKDLLEQWYDEAHVKPGSYLAGLLTDALVEHVRGAIERDEIPDIHTELLEARMQLTESHAEAAQLHEQVQNVTLERDKLAQDLAEMSLKRQEERDHWACKRSALQSQIMLRDIKINELKARLWDAHEAQKKAQGRCGVESRESARGQSAHVSTAMTRRRSGPEDILSSRPRRIV